MEILSRVWRWIRINPLSAFIILSILLHLVLIFLLSRREVPPDPALDLIRFDLASPPVPESPEEILSEIPEPPPEPAADPPREEVIPPPPPPAEERPSAGVILPEPAAPPGKAAVPAGPVLPGYIATLQAIIDREIEYPPLASRQRREGEVAVVFILHRSGRLLRLAIAPGGESSFEPFNREALRAVRRAADRFPPFPKSLEGEDLTFRLPITFTLR
ncbi:MAG: energy transducer TonB [Candidatus Erginobacter occultus]|nr:energy transducer TonB [Candidatus Erginobacter occultus]